MSGSARAPVGEVKHAVIPAKAGLDRYFPNVKSFARLGDVKHAFIPAKAGTDLARWNTWVPAFAGMTIRQALIDLFSLGTSADGMSTNPASALSTAT